MEAGRLGARGPARRPSRRRGPGLGVRLGTMAARLGGPRARGAVLLLLGLCLALPLGSYRAGDPSLNADAAGPVVNSLGRPGAIAADLAI